MVERDRNNIESAGLICKAAPRQKVYRHLANPVLLPASHRLGTITERRGRPRLDLHEHNHALMAGDDVNFSIAGAVAAIKKFVPAATKLGAREIFAEFSQGLAAIFRHGGNGSHDPGRTRRARRAAGGAGAADGVATNGPRPPAW
jgi:hypothetical protein